MEKQSAGIKFHLWLIWSLCMPRSLLILTVLILPTWLILLPMCLPFYTLEFVTFLDTTGTTGHSWFYFNQVSAGIFQEYCAQSNPTLCSPMDCSLPGSSVHGFARQEYWTGCDFLLQGIPVPEIKPASIVSLALVDGFFTTTATWEDPSGVLCLCNLQIWFEEGEYWR